MKILLAVNDINAKGNGLDASARTIYRYLTDAGHEVRVLTLLKERPDTEINIKERPDTEIKVDYPLPFFYFPFFQPILDAHQYSFVKCPTDVITEAVKWADIIHLEEPFALQRKTAKIAKKFGKPCVGTYHIHPENIYYSLLFKGWKFVNHITLWVWKKTVFDKCSDIQCPTQNVMDRLQRFGFKSRMHLIPNGLVEYDNIPKSKPDTSPYLILSIGRLSLEKDQFTLLRAMKYSKYADKIQLFFAGEGSAAKPIKQLAERLHRDGVIKNEPKFKFLSKEEINNISSRSYLYVHTAIIEVEGLSCLEALRVGAVPVIAEGPLTATSQFALDDMSKFPQKDPKALAERIDWWIEHPERREQMSAEYAKSVYKYDIKYSVKDLVNMYEMSIQHNKK